MGLSGLTVLILKNNPNIIIDAGGPSTDNGKYVGWIVHDNHNRRPILNTEAIYDTAEAAIVAMRKIVDICKKCGHEIEEKVESALFPEQPTKE